MELTKQSVLKLLSRVPFVGNWARLEHCKWLLTQFDQVERGFNSPTVRFADALKLLYDNLLETSQLHFEEDFKWFNTIELNTFTKTSGEAHRLLEALHKGLTIDVEDFYRSHEVRKNVGFMQWYSSSYTLDLFFANGVSTVGMYCEVNAEQVSVEQALVAKKRPWNPPLDAFLASRYFKMMVEDLITVARIVVHSQIRVLNGEVQKATKGKSA